MKLEIKAFWIDDPSISLEDFSPTSKDFFGIWIGFKVGFSENLGSDDFRVLVCSPNWLIAESSNKRAAWGRHTLLMKEFDYELMVTSINLLVEQLSGDDWEVVSHNLSKFVEWEFEDYRG